MIVRFILALVVTVAAGLICYGIGLLMTFAGFSAVVALGNFLKACSGLVGILAGVWFFFAGSKKLVIR